MKSFDEVMSITRGISSETAFSDAECRRLYDLCAEIVPGGTVVEIGCQIGRTSSIILQMGQEGDYDCIHIDPWTSQWEYQQQWCKMAHEIDTPYTLLKMRTDQALELSWFPESIDLLLIDGDHTEAGVKVDTRMAERVQVGGILLAHDYARESLPDVYSVMSQYAVPPKWEYLRTDDTLGSWRRIAQN